MGLTNQSTGIGIIDRMIEIKSTSPEDFIIALAGNPNTGKSTVFNSLTGLKQHTGNWPGKTVTNAQGRYSYRERNYTLVDLPGTYSILANSVEEQIARDFICFGNPQVTIVVMDATCLERNLNLALQILEITDRVVLCVNLMDEARRKNISINLNKLSEILGVPVVGTSARNGEGLDNLKNAVEKVALGKIKPNPNSIAYNDKVQGGIEELTPYINSKIGDRIDNSWLALRLIDRDNSLLESISNFLKLDLMQNRVISEKLLDIWERLSRDGYTEETLRDNIVTSLIKESEIISKSVVTNIKNQKNLDYKIDNILTSKTFGFPIMIALLGIIFWITIVGANYPSEMLAKGFFWIEEQLLVLFSYLKTPPWIHEILVLGMYRTLAWVVSVMLPPMAIFFPIFTLLEDLGYLPRIAFNLDYYFKKACTHGKQALTMCMGFGCNAAGVIACRIIDSPRERLIGIITNNFVPCNGRFPILIAMAGMFIAGFAGIFGAFAATLSILVAIVLGIFITLIISRILSKTILKGLPSTFTLELPPYRKPQIGRIIIRSIFDRTLFVLGRAVVVAAPAGAVIWIMGNINLGGISLLVHCARFFDPFARLIGLDGYIFMAFILGLPANEIVIPILIMSYMSKGSMLELSSLNEMKELFINNGWTWMTAVCTMIFTLNHWPCATTLLTIRKETQSWKWTWISFIVPTITGIIICFIVAQTARILGIV
ncbi:MAG TPA: ferrous iron transport protein B [Eubacteriaceae bacterium]|nr:ferrous iron transport protein B [Eubacteriaceae bacterium]